MHAVVGLLPFVSKQNLLTVYEKEQTPTSYTTPLFVKLPLPSGLKQLLQELSFQILRYHPVDMYGYLANYLEEKMSMREEADSDKTNNNNGASEMHHAKEAKHLQKSLDSLLSEDKNEIIQNENIKLMKKSDKIFKEKEAPLPSMRSVERKKYVSYKTFSGITEKEEADINDKASSLQNYEKNGSVQYCKSGDADIKLDCFEENDCKPEKHLNNNLIFLQDKKVNDSRKHYNVAIKNLRTDVSNMTKDRSHKIAFKKVPLLRDVSCQADAVKHKNKIKKDNCINLSHLKTKKSDKYHVTIGHQREKRNNVNTIKFLNRVEPGQLASTTFEIFTEVQELKRINIMFQESESAAEKPVCQLAQHIDIVGRKNEQTLRPQLHLNIRETMQIKSSRKTETCINATSNSLIVNYKKEKFNADYRILLETSCNSETIQKRKQKMISGYKTNFFQSNLKNQALIEEGDKDVKTLSEYKKNEALPMQINALPNDNQNCSHFSLPVPSKKNLNSKQTSARFDESTFKNKIHNSQEYDQYLFGKLQLQTGADKINTFQSTSEKINNVMNSTESQDLQLSTNVNRLHFRIEYEDLINKSEDIVPHSSKETMNYEDLLHAVDNVLEKNVRIEGNKIPNCEHTMITALLRESEKRAETAIKEALDSPSLLNEANDCTEIQYMITRLLNTGTSRTERKSLNSKKIGKNKNRKEVFNFEQILKYQISYPKSSSKRIFKNNRNKFSIFTPKHRYKKTDLYGV